MSYQAELDFAKNLADQAGKIMTQYFRADSLGMTWKEDDTPLTVADTTINQLVIDSVIAAYPDYGIIGEEKSHEPKRASVWVVDPIDGTIPYSLGMPTSNFSLALVRDGVVLVAVIYDPFLQCLYSAVRGQGAFLNDEPIHVSAKTDFKHTYALAPGDFDDALRQNGARLLGISCFTYMAVRVASGEMVVASMEHGTPWDAAAASLIVEEAGGMSTDLKGKPRKYNEWGDGILMTNGLLHEEVVRIIADAHTRH
jgi:myo-inositol-1(or 4)-monophosphatase